MAKQRTADTSMAMMGLGLYDKKAHLNCCNIYDSGISHFACFPASHPIENDRIHLFHDRSRTVKVFALYIQTLLDNSYLLLGEFSRFLLDLKQ